MKGVDKMALFDVITGLLGGLAAAASSNKNNNSNKTGSTGNTGSSTGAGSSGGGSAGTPYDAYGDLGEKILNATTDAEKQAYATLRQQKEDYMKAAGTWDPSWKTTSEFYTAPQQKLPQMPNLDLSAYLGSQNYLNQMQAQNQQYLNSMKQTQKQNANASYDELSRQAYIQKLQNEKNAPKYMAMTGQTGGLSETTAIAPAVAYGNTLSDIGTSRAQTLSQIDLASDEQALQIAMAYADKAIAQANADRNLSYSAYRDQMGDYQYNQGFQYQAGRDNILDDRYNTEWAYQTAQKEKQEAYNRAMDLIANGILPSDDVLTAAGISKADAQALVNKANTVKPTGSGSSGSKTKYTKTQYDIALSRATNGDASNEVRDIIEGYTGMAMEDVLSAYGIENETGDVYPRFSDSRTQTYYDSVLRSGIEPTQAYLEAVTSAMLRNGIPENDIALFLAEFGVNLEE